MWRRNDLEPRDLEALCLLTSALSLYGKKVEDHFGELSIDRLLFRTIKLHIVVKQGSTSHTTVSPVGCLRPTGTNG